MLVKLWPFSKKDTPSAPTAVNHNEAKAASHPASEMVLPPGVMLASPDEPEMAPDSQPAPIISRHTEGHEAESQVSEHHAQPQVMQVDTPAALEQQMPPVLSDALPPAESTIGPPAVEALSDPAHPPELTPDLAAFFTQNELTLLSQNPVQAPVSMVSAESAALPQAFPLESTAADPLVSSGLEPQSFTSASDAFALEQAVPLHSAMENALPVESLQFSIGPVEKDMAEMDAGFQSPINGPAKGAFESQSLPNAYQEAYSSYEVADGLQPKPVEAHSDFNFSATNTDDFFVMPVSLDVVEPEAEAQVDVPHSVPVENAHFSGMMSEGQVDGFMPQAAPDFQFEAPSFGTPSFSSDALAMPELLPSSLSEADEFAPTGLSSKGSELFAAQDALLSPPEAFLPELNSSEANGPEVNGVGQASFPPPEQVFSGQAFVPQDDFAPPAFLEEGGLSEMGSYGDAAWGEPSPAEFLSWEPGSDSGEQNYGSSGAVYAASGEEGSSLDADLESFHYYGDEAQGLKAVYDLDNYELGHYSDPDDAEPAIELDEGERLEIGALSGLLEQWKATVDAKDEPEEPADAFASLEIDPLRTPELTKAEFELEPEFSPEFGPEVGIEQSEQEWAHLNHESPSFMSEMETIGLIAAVPEPQAVSPMPNPVASDAPQALEVEEPAPRKMEQEEVEAKKSEPEAILSDSLQASFTPRVEEKQVSAQAAAMNLSALAYGATEEPFVVSERLDYFGQNVLLRSNRFLSRSIDHLVSEYFARQNQGG